MFLSFTYISGIARTGYSDVTFLGDKPLDPTTDHCNKFLITPEGKCFFGSLRIESHALLGECLRKSGIYTGKFVAAGTVLKFLKQICWGSVGYNLSADCLTFEQKVELFRLIMNADPADTSDPTTWKL